MEWKKLRDNHRDSVKRMKMMKTGSGADCCPNPWKYAELMDFLLPHMKNRPRSTNISSPPTDLDQSQSPSVSLDPSIEDDDASTSAAEPLPGRLETDISDQEKDFRTQGKKRKSDNDEVMNLLREMEENHKRRAMERDERRMAVQQPDGLHSFYESMYATTKKFPPWLQRDVKKKIFVIITEAEESLEICSSSPASYLGNATQQNNVNLTYTNM